jgi:hypothetical protein
MPAKRPPRWRGIPIVLLFAAACGVVACSGPPQPARRVNAGTTYYLSPSGNDAAAGTSPATAWRTVGHASRVSLRPGDRLLLQGGQQFTGQLTIGRQDAGNAARPLVIGSYGHGRATITSIGAAVYVHDTAGIDISDLDLRGKPPAGHSGAGLILYNDLPAGHRLDHVSIDDVNVSGFDNGIAFGGQNDGAGFGNVQVSNCVLSDNVDSGLESYGATFNATSPSYANQSVSVLNVVASQNHGDPQVKTHNTGNGIVLGSVHDGTIAWSTADNNGGSGGDVQGPAGIWTYDSTDVSIEHDLSFDNRTPNRVDGNGFGLDQNTSDSLMQDNLSYGNDGTGFLVYSGLNNKAQTDNVVRYNISSADVRDASTYYGGISVIGDVANTEVYQNTVIMTSAPSLSPPGLRLGAVIRGVTVRNNIFASNYGPVIADSSAVLPSMANLQGNDYFTAFGAWSVAWGATTYYSLAAWRAASSQEIVAGKASGSTANPDMAGTILGLRTKSVASMTAAGSGFILHPGSPLIGAGLDLARFGTNPGSVNYAGKQESTLHPNVGAQ